MVGAVDRGKIIGMKHAGLSNHEISRRTGHDRKTISKIWSQYCALMSQMKEPGADVRKIQERVNEKPKYNGKKRVKRKFTEELQARLKEIIDDEKAKTRRMGAGHKQKLTNKQIHEKVRAEALISAYQLFAQRWQN